jgi:predicted permease
VTIGRAYRLLLHLLPSARRRAYGEAMAVVFSELARETLRSRGAGGLFVLWIRETAGMFRFALRDRLAAIFAAWTVAGDTRGSDGARFSSDLKWAWRSVRGRGWRAGLEGTLLAIALAANTTVFSAVDSLVFRRVPYHGAEGLIELNLRPSSREMLEWRRQTDLFASLHGYATRPVFLQAQGQPEIVDVADVTPGLIDMLGVSPRWGRPLIDADARETSGEVVLISENLATRRFGRPADAVGRKLETTGAPLIVVGVMSEDFLFPAKGFEIWRVLDLAAPSRPVTVIGRIAPDQTLTSVTQAMTARGPAIAASVGSRRTTALVPSPLRLTRITPEAQRLLLIIAGAALCLLLTACANVASLELASAFSRMRAMSVHLALGATRSRLIRNGLFEGLLILGPAVVAAAGLALYGTRALAAAIPERVFNSANPIDLDSRALTFMTLAGLGTWLVVSVPVAMAASRSRIVDLLKLDARTMATSRASMLVRHALTVIEVTLAVVLLCGGLLYLRTYTALVTLAKGFDSTNLAVVSLTLPMQSYPTSQARELLAEQVVARLAARPGVRSVTHSDTLPPDVGESYQAALQIDGRPVATNDVSVGLNRVDSRFFSTLNIAIRRGEAFSPGASADRAVIDEAFARSFWPDEDPVGHQFRISSSTPALTIAGVAAHVRSNADDPSGPSDRHFQVYVPRQPPPPPAPSPAGAAPVRDQALYAFITLAVRLEASAHAADLLADVRAIDSRFRLRIDPMDAVYAGRFDDTLLATSVISGFGSLAFFLAMAGLYGVLAVLVAGRVREIGIRMALGADRRAIARLVIGSSMRLVTLGVGAGLIATAVCARLLRSQLFGVSPIDLRTYALVALAVALTALVASWAPARTAVAVDPAVTLRME